ncbi:MAG: hypothetical protein HC769_26790 [Cyanobacteria bacterium CRU_2_1]|nr:hypothetical protein [Cyanobacteria bacterium RU_5_0]NJR62116.1 hypothetical protein [Cyanobacteria bacterium CRU_2_1]
MNVSLFNWFAIALGLPVMAVSLVSLPQSSQAQSADGFFCDETREFPTVVAVSNGERIDFITFTSDWAPPPFDDVRVRCNQVAAKFQSALLNNGADGFNRLTFDYVSNQPVLCLPSEQDRACQRDSVLITFRNELQGCLFVPAFLENLADQSAGGVSSNTDFEAMRDLCRQQFPDGGGQSQDQIETAFRALNPFTSN